MVCRANDIKSCTIDAVQTANIRCCHFRYVDIVSAADTEEQAERKKKVLEVHGMLLWAK
jgi:hypothetical protein